MAGGCKLHAAFQVAMKVNAALVLGLLFLSATIVRADTSDLGYEADFDVFDE
ncbi:hypothetical protein H632_c628p0, partial [Helicosporidium sp. ATCC 50920]